MKNHYLKVLCAATLFTAPAIQAEDTLDFKLGLGFDVGFSVMAQFNNNMNLAIGDDGIAFDYLFANGKFNDEVPFTWFVGGGAWVGWGDHWNDDDFGIRVPLGLDWNFAKKWDAFVHLHPSLNYNNNQNDLDLDLGAALGVRYQF